MKAYIVFALTFGVCVALARWQPASSFPRLLRNYFLLLLGGVLTVFASSWLLKHVGLGQFAEPYSLLLAILGAATVAGAITKAPVYWDLASHWGFYASMSDRTRQLILCLLGLLLTAAGVAMGARTRHAYVQCQEWYNIAQTISDSEAVLERVPDSDLRPPRGRLETRTPAPMKCRALLR